MRARQPGRTLTRFAVAVGLALAPAALRAQLAPAPNASSGQSPAGPALLAPAPAAVRARYLDAAPLVLRDPQSRRVTLAVDITPKAGMRVYAPGNKDYKPVDLTLDVPGGWTAGATRYPKAEDFLFVPLNERVRVYTSTFRLTRELAGGKPGVAPASDATSGLTVTGRLDYQACDDAVCYLPQSVPLTWTVR